MAAEFARAAAEDVERFMREVLARLAMRPDDGAIFSEALLWADLRGQHGHGIARFPIYLDWLTTGDIDPTAIPVVEQESAARFVLDAKRAAGPVAMMRAVELAIGKSRSTGLCHALIRATGQTGGVGRYAYEAAKRGCAALITVAGPPIMAYHGASIASLSTAPIAIAVPGEGEPVVLDIATSAGAFGKLTQAREAGTDIPEGWALTAEGKPTTDPCEAAILMPMAGHKGSGLSLMIELLVSMFLGAPMLTGPLESGKRVADRRSGLQNAMMLVFDITSYRRESDYQGDVSRLVSVLKGVPRRDDLEELLLPGERGARNAALQRQIGIPITEPT
jgi:ureidoglycolate dehydrogenase (NAD+)